MEGQNIDEKSQRPIIEGMGAPIDGGVFRRSGFPGIVVDSSKLDKIGQFNEYKEVVLNAKSDLLKTAVQIANQIIPVGEGSVGSFSKRASYDDRFSLNAFIDKDKKPVAVPDAKALFVALVIEMRLKKEKGGQRKVGIIKDSDDGHAVVVYEGKSGKYKYDPTKGDGVFKLIENERT